MPTVFENPAALLPAVGVDLGSTDWVEVTQERVNQFADATGDYRWTHVDAEKAAEGPFGAPITHGYLTLALTNLFLPELLVVNNISMGVNYGVNKVRFPAPVIVGSRIRGHGVVTEAAEVAGGVQVIVTMSVEIAGGAKPACIVESISRFLA